MSRLAGRDTTLRRATERTVLDVLSAHDGAMRVDTLEARLGGATVPGQSGAVEAAVDRLVAQGYLERDGRVVSVRD